MANIKDRFANFKLPGEEAKKEVKTVLKTEPTPTAKAADPFKGFKLPEEVDKFADFKIPDEAKTETGFLDLGEYAVNKSGEFGWNLLSILPEATPLGKPYELARKGVSAVTGVPEEKMPQSLPEMIRGLGKQAAPTAEKAAAVQKEFPIGAPLAEMAAEAPYYALGGSVLAAAGVAPAAVGAVTGAMGGAARTRDANITTQVGSVLGEAALGWTLGKVAVRLGLELTPDKKEALAIFKKYGSTPIRDMPDEAVNVLMTVKKPYTIQNQVDDVVNNFLKGKSTSKIGAEKFLEKSPVKAGSKFMQKESKHIIDKMYQGKARIALRKFPVEAFDNIIDPKLAIPEREIANRTIKDEFGNVVKRLPAIRRKSGFFARKSIETQPVINDVGDQFTSPLNVALSQDGIPRESGKYGAVFNNIWNPTQEAVAEKTLWRTGTRNTFKDIAKRNGIGLTKKDGVRLTQLMETIPNKELEMLPIDELMKKYPQLKLNSNYFTAAKEFRGLLDQVRGAANQVRVATGNEPVGYIESYIPHMTRTNRWADLLREHSSKIAENLDFVVPNKKTNPFAFERLGLLDPNKRELNFFKLMDTYTNAMSNDIFVTPAIENIKVHNSVLRARGLNKAANFWDDYVRTGLVGKSHFIDNKLGFTKDTKKLKVLMAFQEARVKGALLGNVTWSMITQPSSLALTVKETGLKNTFLGAYDWFTKKATRDLVKSASSMKIKTGRGANIVYRGMMDQFDNQIYKTKIDKFNDIIGVLASTEEKHLQGLSIAAGLREGKSLGFKGKDLLNFANNVGEVTQSMYGRESRPLILNSDLTRSVFPFQSFRLEALGHIRQMMGTTGMTASARKRLGMAVNLMTGLTFANFMSRKVRGQNVFDIESVIPFIGADIQAGVQKVAGKIVGEGLNIKNEQLRDVAGSIPIAGPIIVGEAAKGGAVQTRAPFAPIQDFKNMISGTSDMFTGADKEGGFKKIVSKGSKGIADFVFSGSMRKLRQAATFYGLGLTGLGGAAQVNRIVEGLIASEKGKYESVSGKEMFKIKGNVEKAKAMIMGPYGTAAGKEYLKGKKGMKKKSIARL